MGFLTMKNDGGTAFPLVTSASGGYFESGMSLRDYFASLVLPHIIDQHRAIALAAGELIEEKHAVRSAYEYADLMLAERDK